MAQLPQLERPINIDKGLLGSKVFSDENNYYRGIKLNYEKEGKQGAKRKERKKVGEGEKRGERRNEEGRETERGRENEEEREGR